MSKIALNHLLIGLIVVWAVCCVYSRGPAILAYIAMQAATSGVFAWAILKALKKCEKAAPDKEAGPQLPGTATPQAG